MDEDSGSNRSGPDAAPSEEPEDTASNSSAQRKDQVRGSPSQGFRRRTMQGSRRLNARLSFDRLKPRILDRVDAMRLTQSPSSAAQEETTASTGEAQGIGSQDSQHAQLLRQVAAWLKEEEAKRSADPGGSLDQAPLKSQESLPRLDSYDSMDTSRRRAPTNPDTEVAIDRLEKILREYTPTRKERRTRDQSYFHRRKSSSSRMLHKLGATATATSDTEYQQDGDAIVPTTDVVLDNTKTLSYTGGAAGAEAETLNYLRNPNDRSGWYTFKSEILRLTHTLRLKGWRRVPLQRGQEINVQRLSGALTNAVYVVAPPEKLPEPTPPADKSSGPPPPRKRPNKLLLRIYGPQVDHLIDREKELQILRRLARQNIGPRLLGTFANGRFEQYYEARTLKPEDLRVAATSNQIAKRMRELHDGISVLPEERRAGPFIWQNWRKWAPRCEEVVTWLDEQVLSSCNGRPSRKDEQWKTRGLVCGVPWARFRKAVEDCRAWLAKQQGGDRSIRQHLVFAHNDTQYGNLLRLQPPGASPLLLPANEHKQLVVIDFEYAGANPRGLEFANHFSEWCYNYHAPPGRAHACNARAYPHPAEQRRFLHAYAQHRPPGLASTAAAATLPMGAPASASSVSIFALDARAPGSGGGGPGEGKAEDADAEERRREEALRREVEALAREARRWRVACSAQWVAWGIVQAKVPGMEAGLAARRARLDGEHGKKSHWHGRRLPHRHGHRHGHPRAGRGPEASAEAAAGPPDGSAGAEPAPDDPDAEGPGGDGEPDAADAAALGEVPHDHETADDAGFDYLAYARDRALFFWGDMLELGLVRADELPPDVVEEAKRVPY